jgi:ribosomal protein S13
MADTNETITDIIAEIRALSNPISDGIIAINGRSIADRLEAALKRDTKELRAEIERLKEERNYSGVRERERLRAKGFAIVPKEQLERGDAAKLREVCEKMLDLLTAEGFEDGGMSIELDEKQVIMWRNRFRAAISAPAEELRRGRCSR